MADVNCYGQLVGSGGAIVPLLNTAQTETGEEETQTDLNFVGSSQTAGTFWTQQYAGQSCVQAGIICENDFLYSFLRSAGKIKLAFPVGSGVAGGSSNLPAALPYPKPLASGDQVITQAIRATDRDTAVTVACTNGEYHVFDVRPAGSGEHEYVSVISGESVGLTLQGRRISHWFATSGNNDAEITSPVYLLDGSGIPTASVAFTCSTGNAGATFQRCVNGSVSLNSRMVFRTDA